MIWQNTAGQIIEAGGQIVDCDKCPCAVEGLICDEFDALLLTLTELSIEYGSDSDFVLQCDPEPDVPLGSFVVPIVNGRLGQWRFDNVYGIGSDKVLIGATVFCNTVDGEPDPVGDKTFYTINTSICVDYSFGGNCVAGQGCRMTTGSVELPVGEAFRTGVDYVLDTRITNNGGVGLICFYQFGGNVNPTPLQTVYPRGVTINFS